MSNTTTNTGYNQVCVWPGTLVGAERLKEFEEFMAIRFDVRVLYLEEVTTAPDYRNGYPVEDTGGRNDVFFAVHDDDIAKFAVARVSYGIRWIEDVYANGGGALYPERIAEYQTWATA